MSAQPVAGNTPQPTPGVTKLPEVVIEEGRFEGKEVGSTLITVSGAAKMVPQAAPGKDGDRVLTVDDVVTVQLDMKVTGIQYDVDGNGVLTRIQKMRPIEGTAQVIDVLRARDTRIR